MKLKHFLLLLLCAVHLTSCVSTLKVKRGKGAKNNVEGIPFYTYKAVLQQETKYVYRWITLELRQKVRGTEGEGTVIHTTRLKSGADVLSIQMALTKLNDSRGGLDGPAFEKLAGAIKSARIEDTTIASLYDTSICKEGTPPDLPHGLTLIDNSWKRTAVVDYTTPYYINGRTPLLGKSEFTQELAPNGTLSKVTASTDLQLDELLGVFAGLAAPLASVKVARIEAEDNDTEAAADGAPEPQAEEGPDPTPYEYAISLKEEGWLYVFVKETDINHTAPTPSPDRAIGFCLKNANYKRLAWPPKPPSTTAAATNKPTIGISGSISLPKSE